MFVLANHQLDVSASLTNCGSFLSAVGGSAGFVGAGAAGYLQAGTGTINYDVPNRAWLGCSAEGKNS